LKCRDDGRARRIDIAIARWVRSEPVEIAGYRIVNPEPLL